MTERQTATDKDISADQSQKNVEPKQAAIITDLNPSREPFTSHLPPIEGEGGSFMLRVKDMLTLPTDQSKPERPHKHWYNRSHRFKTGRIAVIKYDGTPFRIVEDAGGRCRLEIWLKNKESNDAPSTEPQIVIFDGGEGTLEFETSQRLFPPLPDTVQGYRKFIYSYSSIGYPDGFSICRFKLTVNNQVVFNAPDANVTEHDLEGILFRIWDKDPHRR